MKIEFSTDDLEPVIERCVARLVDRFANDDRLLYDEPEAARLCSVPRHVLRDERLRGKVRGVKVGKKIRYSRAALLEFIREQEAQQ